MNDINTLAKAYELDPARLIKSLPKDAIQRWAASLSAGPLPKLTLGQHRFLIGEDFRVDW